jgi:AbrB family looped-hinge helix DNA binding protein
MSTATLSSDYQIALPEELREAMHLHPGQEFELISKGSVIQLIPKMTTQELSAVIAAGVASGQGRPADEFFDRLENKYRKQAEK